MFYNNSRKQIEALKNKDTTALGTIIEESCRNLYVYAAAILKNDRGEFKLLVDTYISFWHNVPEMDPDCNMDIALKKILLKEAGVDNKHTGKKKAGEFTDTDFDQFLRSAVYDVDRYWVMPDNMEEAIINKTMKAIKTM